MAICWDPTSYFPICYLWCYTASYVALSTVILLQYTLLLRFVWPMTDYGDEAIATAPNIGSSWLDFMPCQLPNWPPKGLSA